MLPGVYVVGWLTRGPSGVIGRNKPDSAEPVERLLEDVAAGRIGQRLPGDRDAVDRLLASRGVRIVSFSDWQRLDAAEWARGTARAAPARSPLAVTRCWTYYGIRDDDQDLHQDGRRG
jgi:ferredoxin--NADP+ reductase